MDYTGRIPRSWQDDSSEQENSMSKTIASLWPRHPRGPTRDVANERWSAMPAVGNAPILEAKELGHLLDRRLPMVFSIMHAGSGQRNPGCVVAASGIFG